jgi:glycosyltransferase involved in cell wall biosynthesis
MSGSNAVSVVIPTHNKATRLRLALESLRLQDVGIQAFEVVVVDDGSTDSTEDVVLQAEHGLNIRYVHQERMGRSAARNAGARLASAELLVFCDDDMIASRCFVREHSVAHRDSVRLVVHGRIWSLPYLKFFEDPTLGTLFAEYQAARSSIVALRKHLIASADIETFHAVEQQAKAGLLENILDCVFTGQHEDLRFLAFTGGNVSILREEFVAAEGFDERFGLIWGAEDLELGYRLQKTGFSFVRTDAACNYHIVHARKSPRAEMEQAFELFYQKHNDPLLLHLPEVLMKGRRALE